MAKVQQEVPTLEFNAEEMEEIRGAIDTLSPEVKEKFLGAVTVVNAVASEVFIDGLSADINRGIAIGKSFLAKADRRGYIHRDDRYIPLKEKAVATLGDYLGTDEQNASQPRGVIHQLMSFSGRIIRK